MNAPSLPLVLTLNAITSALAGILLIVAPNWVAGLLGEIPAWICQLAGTGLLVFGIAVGCISRQLPRSWSATRWILALDIVWLVATPIVMLVFARYLSLLGHILLMLVAAIVLWYAWWEAYWVRHPMPAEKSIKGSVINTPIKDQ